MEKSTLILILLLVFILLFATHIQHYTGQMVKTWFTRIEYCSDSDGEFVCETNGKCPAAFISGKVNWLSREGYSDSYIDTCDGHRTGVMYEGTCDNNRKLFKVKFVCPQGCSAHGPDGHGACICEQDRECPTGYTCHREGYCYIPRQ